MKPRPQPVFGEPKSESGSRTVDISPELTELLVAHKKHQAEIKMRRRDAYRDHGLVFAKEEGAHLATRS